VLLESRGFIGVETCGRLLGLTEEEVEFLRMAEAVVTVEFDFGELRDGATGWQELPWRRLGVEDAG
jgi:hypothetical protein